MGRIFMRENRAWTGIAISKNKELIDMENKFVVKLKNFFLGASPLSHLDELTEIGNSGHYSSASNVDIITKPGIFTQGPDLVNLTDGTQAGAITELVNHILDVAVSDDTTYGISTTKLYKITSTAVINTAPFPQAITGCVSGKSVAYLKGGLYYFFKRTSDGAIGTYDLASTFNHAWQTGLQAADLMPSATKEDILLFGHGRYVGVYFQSTASMNLTRLDFGTNHEVADIVFHGNQWIIAVNNSVGHYSQIYSYDAGATTALLSDEIAVGLQKIGFLFPLNGVVYVAYRDLSFTGGYKIGYLAGRKIESVVSFSGSLPLYNQKTLFKNTILFLSGGLVYSAGAVVGELPFAISQLADGGYTTCGALAAPFGTPMIASTEGSNFRLAKFSGYTISSNWRSIIISTISGKLSGYIDFITVRTNTLGSGAAAVLKLEFDQASSISDTYNIATTNKRKHIFNINKLCDDFRIYLDFSTGSASNPCEIKEITIFGHYKED